MQSFTALITELENKLPFIGQQNPAVSKASVGWHVEHSLLALVKMINALENSNPADYKKKFNFKLVIVSATGKFPRGRAQAPASVIPSAEAEETAIRSLAEKARQKVGQLNRLSPDKFFKHPVFGDLRVKQARKIMSIHTYHHLKIINDILR